jgi:hypothetical protein
MARKEKTIHYIYKTTCSVTNRYYIGMHSTCNIDDGYMGSGKRLRYSIRKHGIENHIREILDFFDTRELLIEAEKQAITLEMITDKDCMNLKGGGDGGFVSLEAVRKGAEITNSRHSDKLVEWRRKGGSSTFKKHGLQKNFKCDWTGKKHSDKTKEKIGEKNKIKQMGVGNSQYNTCWITNEKENKKIKKDGLIPNGWRLGRKINKRM